MTRPISCLLFSILTLVIATLLFEVSDLDLLVQHWFYNVGTQQWLLDKSDPVLRFIFYDGIKDLLLALTAALLITALVFRKQPRVAVYQQGLWLTLLSIALILATASGLKAVTNVACPTQLTEFGGGIPHVKLFEDYPPGQRPAKAQHCFPAGHASGGFALLSLVFLFKTSRNRRLAVAAGLSLGWIMGLYKMFIGDHFLSHTLTSMLLAWGIICAISYVMNPNQSQNP